MTDSNITDREWSLLVSKMDEVATNQKEQSSEIKSMNAAIHELIGQKQGQEKQIYDTEKTAQDALNLSRKNRDDISDLKTEVASIKETSGTTKTTIGKWSDRTFDVVKMLAAIGIGALLTYIGIK